MASLLNRLVGGVENFLKGGPQPAQKPKQVQQQPQRAKIDPRALQAAFQMNQQRQGPSFNSFQNLRAPAPKIVLLPPPQHPNFLSQDMSGPLAHFVGQALQAAPRGLVRIGESGQNLNHNKPQVQFTPHGNLQRAIFGNAPIQSYQAESKQHGGGLPAALAIAGSLVGDVPGVPGKKQAAKVADTSVAKLASKARQALSTPESSPLSPKLPVSSPKVNTRSFPKTIRQSQNVQANTPITPDNLMKTFKDIPYFRELQKPVLEQAHNDIKANPMKVLNEVLSPLAKPTSQHIAKGTVLLADSLHRGDAATAEKISNALSAKGTGLGQAVSMFNTINRTTPSGAFHWATNLGADSKTAQNFYKQALKVDKMAEGQDKNIARYRLAESISQLDPSNGAKQGVELWRSLLLTGPRTHTGNLLSNTIESGTKQGLVNPLAAAIDKGVGLVTGKRSRGLTVKGFGSGAKQGADNAKVYLKTGYNPLNAGGKYEANGTTFNNNWGGKIAKGISQPIYRVLGAADQPYRVAARSQALAEQAKAAALNKGLKGQARTDFVKQFMAKPPRAALEHATQIGDRSVFGNQTIMGQIAGSIKRPVTMKGKQVYSGALGEFVVPFTQVPSSIATRIVERSPLGFASAAKDIVNAARGKGFDQYMFTEKLANATVGTGASLAVGKELADHNMITLGYPTDNKEKELWKQEGKQPYSVNIGGKWLSLNYVQPFGSMLAWGAAYQTARKNGDSMDKAAAQAAGEAGKAVTSQSFLQGVSGALNAVTDPAKSAGKYVQSAAQSLIPGFVRTTAVATDPNQREVSNPGQAIRAGIPGWRKGLPAKQDNFGNDLSSGNTNIISSIDAAINPLKPSNAGSTSPTTSELRRLQDNKQGIVPTTIATDSLGKGTSLNADQKRQLQGMYGQGVQEAWSQIIKDPRYKNLSDEAKKKVLGDTSDKILLAAKGQFAADHNLPVPKQNTASKLILQGKAPDFFKTSKGQSTTPADKYQSALDSFNANKSSYTDARKIKEQSTLDRLKVESTYSQNVVDLYGLSKAKVYQYITTNAKGAEIAKQLQTLDQQLKDSGVITSLKFKTGFAPKIATSSTRSRSTGVRRTSSSSRSTGSVAKVATLKVRLPHKPKAVRIGKIPSPKSKTAKLRFKTPTLAKAKKIKLNIG